MVISGGLILGEKFCCDLVVGLTLSFSSTCLETPKKGSTSRGVHGNITWEILNSKGVCDLKHVA